MVLTMPKRVNNIFTLFQKGRALFTLPLICILLVQEVQEVIGGST
jgi:hypothetical protein